MSRRTPQSLRDTPDSLHFPSPDSSSFPPSSSPDRSPSPSPPANDRDRDWIDVLAPNEPGLPIFLANSRRNMNNSPGQVVDSSAARRRGGGSLYEGQVGGGLENDGEEDYDGGKGVKQPLWPSSGIGMESRVAPPPGEVVVPSGKREFAAASPRDGKWDRLIPERRQPQSWVRVSFAVQPPGLDVSRFVAFPPNSQLQGSVAKEVAQEIKPHVPLIIYTFLSLFTRLYRIGANNSVVWDEVRPPQLAWLLAFHPNHICTALQAHFGKV